MTSTRFMRWCLILAVLVAQAACRGAPEAPLIAGDGTTGPSSCASVWRETREDERASGARDGEARRKADEAADACEARSGSRAPQSAPPSAGCEDERDQRGAPPVDREDAVTVYWSCVSDVGPGRIGDTVAYRFVVAAPAPSSRVEEGRIRAVARIYLSGPPEPEADRGFGVLASGLSDLLLEASRDGDVIRVDLDRAFFDRVDLAATAALDRFVSEIGSTMLQFEGAQRLRLEIDGDCDAFWIHTPVGSCRLITPDGLTRPAG